MGNRLGSVTSGASTTYAYPTGSHRLSGLSGAQTLSYAYDANGNQTGAGSVTWAYGGNNRPISVTTASTTTFAINALGQRVRKATGSTATRFVYDEAGRLLGEYDDTGALIQETVWLNDLPVATIRPDGTSTALFYVHPDHLGSPRAVTRPSDNQLVWKWDNTEPFGNSAPDENPSGLGVFAFNLRFPGQYFDAETGRHYNYFRDYDSSIGRYVQSDPIGLVGGINTFAYAFNSPLRFSDPTGENPIAAARGAWSVGTSIGNAINIGIGAATGMSLGVLIYNMCNESPQDREKRCQENLNRDMETCSKGSKRFGKKWFKVCESQAMARYSNCLSGRDKGIDAPLPPWGGM